MRIQNTRESKKAFINMEKEFDRKTVIQKNTKIDKALV